MEASPDNIREDQAVHHWLDSPARQELLEDRLRVARYKLTNARSVVAKDAYRKEMSGLEAELRRIRKARGIVV